MVLKIKAKVIQSPNSHTHYIAIKAAMTQDSQYPFKHGDEVEIEVFPDERRLEVRLPLHATAEHRPNTSSTGKRVDR